MDGDPHDAYHDGFIVVPDRGPPYLFCCRQNKMFQSKTDGEVKTKVLNISTKTAQFSAFYFLGRGHTNNV